jgi:hypothetical protein
VVERAGHGGRGYLDHDDLDEELDAGGRQVAGVPGR